ncbi:MAG: hypothetical protein QXE63_03590 [Zestosphaera sp.]
MSEALKFYDAIENSTLLLTIRAIEKRLAGKREVATKLTIIQLGLKL